MKRATELIVTVDLDEIPGAFHTAESAKEIVQWILKERIGHYSPEVEILDRPDHRTALGTVPDDHVPWLTGGRCGSPCDDGCQCE